MIFLSHNYLDKDLVEPVAVALRDKYNQDNVFYDSWSIRPGDSIIGKMDEGLERCRFFFFFISHNSLNSGMVSLEWQTALHKSATEGISFVAIQVDDSKQPTILTTKLYINLFQEGIDQTITKMIDTIEGTDSTVYKNVYENIYCDVTKTSESEFQVAIMARKLVERDLDVAVRFTNSIEDISFDLGPQNPNIQSIKRGFTYNGYNGIRISEMGKTVAPGKPLYFIVKSKSGSPLLDFGVLLCDGTTGRDLF